MEQLEQPVIDIKGLQPPALFFTLDGRRRNLTSASLVGKLEAHFQDMAMNVPQPGDDAVGSRKERAMRSSLRDYFSRPCPKFGVFDDMAAVVSYAAECGTNIAPDQLVLLLDHFKGQRSTRNLHVFFWGSSPEEFSPEEAGVVGWKLLLNPHCDHLDQMVRQIAASFGWRFGDRLRRKRLPFDVPLACSQTQGRGMRIRNATERRGITLGPPTDA